MIPKCGNCKHLLDHEDGAICGKTLLFTEDEDICLDWETEEVFNPTKLVALAIVVIGIVLLLAIFL